jgi:DNA replication and repair protein RecF
MRLISLTLESFRSYRRLSLELGESDCEVFVGPNGAGKTNIIEAISFLSMGRSCLSAEGEDAMTWGEDFYRIRGEALQDDGEKRQLEHVWQRMPRRQGALFVNDVRTPLQKFIGVLPTVIFLPQDLDLFTGSPSHRRQFLDRLLSQLSPDFVELRLEYERILKQRNALLNAIRDRVAIADDLAIWDTQLAAIAAALTHRRLGLISRMNELLGAKLAVLGEEKWKNPHVQYLRKTTGEDKKTIEAELVALFLQNRERDIILTTTSVGPHRDDWSLLVDTRSISTFASRGQQRAALLGLLLVSAELFASVRGERPIVLLDDVLSEFDDHHQSSLLKALGGHQVIITATHELPKASGLSVRRVQNGAITSQVASAA